MLAPGCALLAGDGGYEPEAAGGPRGWLSLALALAGALVLPLLAAVLFHQLAEAWRAGPDGARPPPDASALAPGAGPPAPGARPPAPGAERARGVTLFTGARPLEASVEHPGGLMLVRVTHRGDGPFALRLLDGRGSPEADGDPVDAVMDTALIDVVGAYQGSRALGLPAGTYRLGVAAGGQWGMAIEQPRWGRALRLPGILAGVGDTATRPFDVPSARTVTMVWTVEPDGSGARPEAELRVRLLDASGRLVTELVAVHGQQLERTLPAGRYLLDVSTGAGVWRVLVS